MLSDVKAELILLDDGNYVQNCVSSASKEALVLENSHHSI